jgi:hypothetical protein
VITMQRHHNDAGRFTIAGISLVVLIVAIAFSKRSGAGLAADVPPELAPAPAPVPVD